MTFKGEAAISRATRATGRALLIASLTLFVFKLGWIETADTSVVGLRFADGKFELAVGWLIGVLAVAHIVQWNGDRLSYAAWNIHGAKLASPRFDGSTSQRLDDLFVSVQQAMTGLAASAEGRALESAERILSELKDLNGRLISFNSYATFYVYIWHLAVPLIAAALAIFWPTPTPSVPNA